MNRRLVGLVVHACTAVTTGAALAQSPQAEGQAAGQTANTAARALVQAASASAVVPGYTTSPAERSLAGRPSLSAEANARLLFCTQQPNDLSCQAALGARASAQTPRPAVSPTDPTVAAARAIAAQPAGQGVSLASVYSGCTTRTVTVSAATYDRQSCFDYLMRSLGNTCQKDLSVNVAWTCPGGATSGPTRQWNPATRTANWTCTVPRPRSEAYCPPPLVGPTVGSTAAFAGIPVCTDASGRMTAAPTRTVVDQVAVAATPVTTDRWNNGCQALEARVPPGYLPPDGSNALPSPLPPMTGPADKCERPSSVCTAPNQTRLINDLPVTRACWSFSNSFDCLNLQARSDCGQPRFGRCTATAAPTCIDQDASLTPPLCTAYRRDYLCQATPATTRTVEDCGAQTFCSGASCFDTSHPPDADFARSVAFLEASREAGKYLDPATLRVFKGFDNRCTKKLFGLVNCCNRGGTSARSLFTNYALARGAVSTLGRAAVSSYTYDALFVSDAPSLILSGFEALWGTGYTSGLAGVLAGDLSVSSFVGSLMPSWWTLAILAIQVSGITSCSDADQTTAMKRDAQLCVALGDYCSKRLPLVRTCVESTQSFCCFNSRLARIINEQGLAQVGRGLGSAGSPDCSGFSVAELQTLDFARLDLSEFYAEIAPSAPDPAALAGSAAGKVPVCYFGSGRC